MNPFNHNICLVILSKHYAPKVYNSLGDIDEVDKQVTDEQIRKFSEIIVRCALFLQQYFAYIYESRVYNRK